MTTPETPLLNASTLFPSSVERAHWDDFLTQALASAHDRVARGPVMPTLDLAGLQQQLAAFDFSRPHEIEPVLSWTIAQMEHGLVHVTHPKYFGLFNPLPTAPSQWADRIAAAFNPQLATWTTSPAAVEIEAHVIRAVAQRAGLPADASGHFTTGGAEANYTALICALTKANPAFSSDGVCAFHGRPVLYTSKESHLAWLKIAHQAGIGRTAVRFVETDGQGRMDPDALVKAIESDRKAGQVPVMVVATAGTTNAGMIDPLIACASAARGAGAWLHVDAAWGGALIASETTRPVLSGIEQADSITIDAHKWFATTMGCGMFITRHRQILSSAFEVSASYMPSNVRDRDPYVTSLQWSRRFLGLRLFLSLAVAGWDGYARHVERAVALAQRLGDQLVKTGWSVANRSPLAVLCIEPPPGTCDVRSVVGRVLSAGQTWVSTAVFEGRDVIRACVTNGETTADDIDACHKALTNALVKQQEAVVSAR